MATAPLDPSSKVDEKRIGGASQLAQPRLFLELRGGSDDELAGGFVGDKSYEAITGSLARGWELGYPSGAIYPFPNLSAPPPDGIRVGAFAFHSVPYAAPFSAVRSAIFRASHSETSDSNHMRSWPR